MSEPSPRDIQIARQIAELQLAELQRAKARAHHEDYDGVWALPVLLLIILAGLAALVLF